MKISTQTIEKILALCASNSLADIIKIINSYSHNATTEDGFTFSQLIFYSENLSIIDSLVKLRLIDPHSSDSYGYTPLHLAAKFNKLEIVRYILENANAKIEAKTNSGQTPLLCAVTHSDLTLIRYLIEQACANINIQLPSGAGVAVFMQNNPNRDVIEYLTNKLHKES